MKFDGTISVGNILTAAVLFIGFYHAHQQQIRALQDIKTRLDLVFEWFTRTVINKATEMSGQSEK